MAEYIERQKLYNNLVLLAKYETGERQQGILGCAETVRIFPDADVAEVVRCKDCIRRYDTDECPMCFLIEGEYYEYTNENGFCDRGERKEGAE